MLIGTNAAQQSNARCNPLLASVLQDDTILPPPVKLYQILIRQNLFCFSSHSPDTSHRRTDLRLVNMLLNQDS
jgi:hypothetical protein